MKLKSTSLAASAAITCTCLSISSPAVVVIAATGGFFVQKISKKLHRKYYLKRKTFIPRGSKREKLLKFFSNQGIFTFLFIGSSIYVYGQFKNKTIKGLISNSLIQSLLDTNHNMVDLMPMDLEDLLKILIDSTICTGDKKKAIDWYGQNQTFNSRVKKVLVLISSQMVYGIYCWYRLN